MSPRGPDEGPTAGRGEWDRREHDEVFGTLDKALARVSFPASKVELVNEAGSENVGDDRDLPLVKYLQALPERRYASVDEVKDSLNRRWQDVRGLRGAGWGASEKGGAPIGETAASRRGERE